MVISTNKVYSKNCLKKQKQKNKVSTIIYISSQKAREILNFNDYKYQTMFTRYWSLISAEVISCLNIIMQKSYVRIWIYLSYIVCMLIFKLLFSWKKSNTVVLSFTILYKSSCITKTILLCRNIVCVMHETVVMVMTIH